MKTGKILPHSGSVLNDIEGRGFSVITDKGKGMIKRNRWQPHVFAGVTLTSDEEIHAAWEEIKKKEKAGREWQEEYLKDAMKESAKLIEKAEERKWG